MCLTLPRSQEAMIGELDLKEWRKLKGRKKDGRGRRIFQATSHAKV